MPKYHVEVYWKMSGHYEIEATNLEEAIHTVQMQKDTIALPSRQEIVDGSFFVDTNKTIWKERRMQNLKNCKKENL